jgi:uncharacterized protein with von Willebrand factor type A (vWA) domain
MDGQYMGADQAGQRTAANLLNEVERLIAELRAGEEGAADFARIIARLDAGIPKENEAMDALLSRLRATPIAA